MAVDYFLKIQDVPGESTDGKHGGEIDLLSWSWGATNSGVSGAASGSGGGSGKVSMQDFHFTMKMNKASPILMQTCATGKHIPSAILTCRKAGDKQQEYLKINFTDLLISSYQTGGSAGGDELPVDQISFNFAKIEFDYAPQKKDGNLDTSIKRGYDLKKNEKF